MDRDIETVRLLEALLERETTPKFQAALRRALDAIRRKRRVQK
jgi:hypothetical protein